jgi:hypothetical protein
MQKRFAQTIQDRSIQLELGANDLDLDALAELLSDLARSAGQVVGDASQRGGSQFENATLQFADVPVDAIKTIGDLGIMGIARDTGLELTRAENDLADRRKEAVQGLGADPYSGVQDLGCGRGCPCRRRGGNRFRRRARRLRGGL